MGAVSSSSSSWARVERLDAARVVDALRVQTGVSLTLEGACPGGQVGAAYVRWADGHRSVLKWRPHGSVEEMRAGPLVVTEVLRLAGYPAPAAELVAQVGDAVVVVQELLPGRKIEHLGQSELDQILHLNQLQADRLVGRAEVPAMELYLRDDGVGYCLHEPLRRHNRRSAALERWIAAVGADHPARLAGDDAVHQDFHPGNMLTAGRLVTGVVDWDGASRGDRRFDLVTLRFGVHAAETGPGVTERLDAIIDSVPEEVLRPAWAHMSLRMVDWAIRHFSPAEVENWMDLAEQRMS
ncbi:phosphotransferase [Streptomyces sp. NPDC058001]|uniref:phosphotransferase n=1 Tax=Streptomyces sp. NPDC058001 TaxID=3346300 RepID=UPI0036E06907